jgi:hypothetical protein
MAEMLHMKSGRGQSFSNRPAGVEITGSENVQKIRRRRATRACSEREGLEDSSIYPSCALETACGSPGVEKCLQIKGFFNREAVIQTTMR